MTEVNKVFVRPLGPEGMFIIQMEDNEEFFKILCFK